MKVPAAEKRRRAARKRYWKRRMEQAEAKAIEPWQKAARLSWNALIHKKQPDDVRPHRLPHPLSEDAYRAVEALWWLLASGTARIDCILELEWAPRAKEVVNESVPFFAYFDRQKKKRRKR